MTTEQASTQRLDTVPLRASAALARAVTLHGPCLSIFVPQYQPGSTVSPQHTQARILLDAALAKSADTAWRSAIRQSAEGFISGALPEGGGSARVLYVNTEGITLAHVDDPLAHSSLGAYPEVLPLIKAAVIEQELWVLTLNTKRIHLYEYSNGAIRSVALPGSVPISLDAAGHFHTSGGPGQNQTPGGKAGVRFGTSGLREAARDSFDHFCALIDRGLQAYLGGRPLLLMGVREEIAAYRRVSHYTSLLHAEVDGNVATLTPAQLATLARDAATQEYERRGATVLAEFQELRDRSHALADPHAARQTAAEGRVHAVCLRAGTQLAGPDGEEVLNAIAVETLRHGGDVYLLPQDSMPVTQPVCAILRY